MQASEYLKEIGRIHTVIQAKQDKLIRLRSRYGISGGISTDDRVKHSTSADKMTYLVADVIELEKQLDELIAEYIDYRREAKNLVFSLKNSLSSIILYEKYFLFWSVNEIAKSTGKKKQTIKNYTTQALVEFQQALDVVHKI